MESIEEAEWQSIAGELADAWRGWAEEEWYEREIAAPLRSRRRAIASTVEHTTVQWLSRRLPERVGYEVNDRGNQLEDSMGDCWVKVEDGYIPVNVKGVTTAKGMTRGVSLRSLFHAIASGTTNEYRILMVCFDREDPYKIEVKTTDLVRHLPFVGYDAGHKTIHISRTIFDVPLEEIPTRSSLDSMRLIQEKYEDALDRLIQQRQKTKHELERIVAGDTRGVRTFYIVGENGEVTRTQASVEDMHGRPLTESWWSAMLVETEPPAQENPRPGRPVSWTRERMILATKLLIEYRPDFTLEEARELGPTGLASAIQRAGGVTEWKKLVRSEEVQAGSPPALESPTFHEIEEPGDDLPGRRYGYWSEGRRESRLGEIVARHGRLTSANIMATEDGPSLLQVVNDHEGIKQWNRRLGVVDNDDGNNAIRAVGRPRVYANDAEIEADLFPFWTEHPAAKTKDFERLEKKQLLNAINKTHGLKEWRKRFEQKTGRQLPRGRDGSSWTTWTDSGLLHALADVMHIVPWPTQQAIKDHGAQGLLEALRYHRQGGIREWAEQVWEAGLVERPTGAWPEHHRYRLNEEAVERDLIEFLNEHPYADHSDFVSAGREALWEAIKTHGGIVAWRERVNDHLERPVDIGRTWPEERILLELAKVVAIIPNPTKRDIAQHGRRGLYLAITKQGGLRVWLSRLANSQNGEE